MPTVAYFANRFPVAVEPYIGDEIQELRRRGIRVIPGSARRPDAELREPPNSSNSREILCLEPIRVLILLRALGLLVQKWGRVFDLVVRVLLRGREKPHRRLKALLHTWLGAYYAVRLRDRGVDHIHVHHGYFGSWIAMVAARLLGVSFSFTLHGSDLLLNAAYLDAKLQSCRVCVTISEFNRRHILHHHPGASVGKVIVSRLGTDVRERTGSAPNNRRDAQRPLALLAVGRLHAVKDHAFLVLACAQLRELGLDFQCSIAGDGPERQRLEVLIRHNRLDDFVKLLGSIARGEMDSLYRRADVVVLTSRSEGIPLVLMEAMAQGRVVIAPAITGIPELVVPGKTGFLYVPGSIDDLVKRLLFVHELMRAEDRHSVSRLDWIRHAARVQVLHNFNRAKNLSYFCELFLGMIGTNVSEPQDRNPPYENLVLQQI
jgi:glycosyltransferase involved in cell wall biosynthesis